MILSSEYEADHDFGFRVAPLHDLTGDGRPELRVQSFYTHVDGVEHVFTQVFQGSPSTGHPNGGEPFFTVVTQPCEIDLWPTLSGDALGDMAVGAGDVHRVTVNLGLEGQGLTPFDGDLNGDGVVDAHDLALVMESYGTYMLHAHWDGMELVLEDGDGSWSEIEYVPASEGMFETPGMDMECCTGDICICCCGGCTACQCPVCPGGGPAFRGRFKTIEPPDGGPIGPFDPQECPPDFGGSGWFGGNDCEVHDPCNPGCGSDENDVPHGPCHPLCQEGLCGSGYGIEIESVTFSGEKFHDVRRDTDGADYESPHWLSAKAVACQRDPDFCCDGDWDIMCDDHDLRSHPVAFTRDTNATLTVTFRVDQALPPGEIKVRGYALGSGQALFEGTATGGSEKITASDLVSTKTLGDKIAHLEAAAIHWHVRVNDVPVPCNPCTSRNTIYVTLVDPPAGSRYHTVLDIACDGGKNKVSSQTQEIVDGIWNQFKNRNVKRAEDGEQLKYYGSWQVSHVTVANLLKFRDAQCAAWANLLVASLKVHGLNGSAEQFGANYSPTMWVPPGSEAWMLVRTWDFHGPPSGVGELEYVNTAAAKLPWNDTSYTWSTSEVTALTGVPAQNSPNPLSLFGNHVVVEISGVANPWYDPSYGGEPFPTFEALYAASMHGHGIVFENPATANWIFMFMKFPDAP